MVLGLATMVVALMALGVSRRDGGVGPLAIPLAFTFVVISGGFAGALLLPAEVAGAPVYLGLPLRAALVLYGVGLLPILVLPLCYALTFDAMTLSEDDLTRVRALGVAHADASRDARRDASRDARRDASRDAWEGGTLMSPATWPLLQAGSLPPLAQPMIIGVALAYFAVVAAIGVWATRQTRNASDFFVAGQGIGLWTMAIAAMAATLSGFAFIGGPGLLYNVGLGAVFIILPIGVTGTLGAWTMAKRLRLLGEVRGLITVPDAIAARFQSRAARGLSAVAMLVAIIGYMATNILALGLVIDSIFGTGLTAGLWIGMAITLAYSVSGGILAGVYTDLFQGAVMALASVLVFVYTIKVGVGPRASRGRSSPPTRPSWRRGGR